jgi:hypothetical protein
MSRVTAGRGWEKLREISEFRGLCPVVREACVVCLGPVRVIGKSRQRDQYRLASPRFEPDVAGKLMARESWHPEVENPGMRLEFQRDLVGRSPIGRDAHLVLQLTQESRQRFTGIPVIVSDQHSHFIGAARHGPSVFRQQTGASRQTSLSRVGYSLLRHLTVCGGPHGRMAPLGHGSTAAAARRPG